MKKGSVPGAVLGKTMRPAKRRPGQPLGGAGELERLGRGLHAVAAEAGVAFDEDRQLAAAAAGAGGEAVEHGRVVGDDAEARDGRRRGP